MWAVDLAASNHADRENKREEKFSSSYYLRDSCYLYHFFIYTIKFILLYNIYLAFFMSDFNSVTYGKLIVNKTYLKCMLTIEEII